ncbi:hypothetical protein CDAR_208711 [Caerostris darwini]|uniref:Uncharacterized protein n=1 Tax=Caerostris darwini TaxID=1538125 RepID=A0AAV4VSE1_9ARAC|nr:hypothetical protein CDAR_208711 [Caerostris darwini]
MNSIRTFTTQSAFRLFACKPSANKPGGTYDSKEEEDYSSLTTFSHRVLYSSSLQGWGKGCVGPCPRPIVDLQQQIDTRVCSLPLPVSEHFDYLLVSHQQTSLEGLIDSKEEEVDYSSTTTFSHRVLHSSSLQGRGEELCRSLSKSYRRSSAANRYRSHPCVHCHFRYQKYRLGGARNDDRTA